MRGLSAGIIAAGHGDRLRGQYPDRIKPLVPVAGAPLCHWVVRSLAAAGASEIVLLHNSRGRNVEESLRRAFPSLSWTFLEQDTVSSWESFRLVAGTLAKKAEAFLISTVDALIAPSQARSFIDAMTKNRAAAGLALTDFIDDEKPLWADLDSSGRIVALGSAAKRRRLATAGLYYLTRPVAGQMPPVSSFSALRDYLSSLAGPSGTLRGHLVAKALDVDRPQDIRAAESFLKEAGPSW